jgi:hypothetical protein
MNARRRDSTPPYEIMGSRPTTPQASGRGPRPGLRQGTGIGGFFQSMADAWRSGASEPLTLRVPRGMAVSLLVGLLGLLVLAYWVGHSRGSSAAEKDVRAQYEPALTDDGRVPPDRSGQPGASDAGRQAGTTYQPDEADQRVPGNNYLILALYPPQEARRLRAFLTERQVEVMVGPRNNKGLCQVIVLDKGFTPEEYGNERIREPFRNKYLALGRQWQAANDGRGDDLSTMYFQKYEPPAGR